MDKDRVYGFFDLAAKFGIAGVLFFIPISHAFIDSFAGLALLGFIGKNIVKPEFRWLKTRPNLYLAVFFFFMALSLVNSGQYIAKSLVALFFKWGKYGALFLVIQDSIKKRKDLVTFVCIFLFSAGLVAVSGITQLFWGIEFLRGRDISIMKGGIKAITSSFNHCNGLGAYLIIPISLCVAFLKAPRRLTLRSYYLVLSLVAILAFCIFYTYSRGAWIGVLTALITMVFISRKPAIVYSIALIIGILLFIPIFRQVLFSVFQSGGDSDRFKYWQAAITMFKENPVLGKGLGTFMAHFSVYLPGKFISYAHNCFLQILAESGVFSLIAFLGFIYSVLRAGIKKFVLTRDPVLLGGICGIIGFLAHSFFEVSLYSLPLAVVFWLWVGVIAKLGSWKELEKI
ncbi:MAG: O-antigen ligase family protein [Candidatus Omnitrophota bacterium]